MTSVREFDLDRHFESNGSLVVFEDGNLPFPLHRTFVVQAGAGQVRGDHAHRTCNQLLVALKGAVRVSVDDGQIKSEYRLTGLSKGLLIPPMNWATQKYLSNETILMVSCDHPFDESDYIRDYSDFLRNVSAMNRGSAISND